MILADPPYTKCNTQIEVLQKSLQSDIFSRQGKRLVFSPRLSGQITTCKEGNGPGGCFELFATLRRLIRELSSFPPECHESLAEIGQVQGAIMEGIRLMVFLAWGESPPAPEARARWLEPADLALFCELRDGFVRIFGPEAYDEFRTSITAGLPGEPAIFSDGQCINCEFRKRASQVLSPDEVWKRTLFSVPCQQYR